VKAQYRRRHIIPEKEEHLGETDVAIGELRDGGAILSCEKYFFRPGEIKTHSQNYFHYFWIRVHSTQNFDRDLSISFELA
jgi:hypothetical protein